MSTSIHRGRSRLSFVLVIAFIAVLLGVFWQRTQGFADHSLQLDDSEHVLLVEPGDGFNSVLAKVRKLGISQGNDLEWKALASLLHVAGRLQVGEYAVDAGMTPRELLLRLGRGEVIQRKFTIVEGWNFRQVRAALQVDAHLVDEIEKLGDSEVMDKLGRKGLHPEGRFLPETYVFTRGAGELSILGRAADAMDTALAKAWESRDKDLPLKSPDEMLTLASIVEKETGLASERPQIAGVFVRRLRIGMRLQTDPTVIYGIGSAYDGNIRKADLERDTPYNTYLRFGLPPTPIAMPGQAALDAAAHPTDGDALYFVAQGNGGHHFSADLAEHNAAVRKYQLKR